MKLSGTAALYTQLKELENAVAVTKRQIALAEELLAEAPAKKAKSRKPRKTIPGGTWPLDENQQATGRQPKALPYDGIIGKVNGLEAAAD